ncbi:MAG: hypothetical protein LBT43_06420 [Prevotella sp.]|jgi:organic radical activating enzyme|nr:hypothetical protein [Prevotella sp.]
MQKINQKYVVSGDGKQTLLTIALPEGIFFDTCTISAPSSFTIFAKYKRTDFFDFCNIKSRYAVDTIINDSSYRQKLSSIRSGIIFFVTYRCTYKCPFCWQRHDAGEYAKVNPLQFSAIATANMFNRLKPQFIYFTGGEPTLYKDLFILMNNLDPNITIAITSNLGPSFDVDSYAKLVSPEQCYPLGFSYHPSETTEDQFLYKLDKILEAGFQVHVESVLYAPDLPRLLSIKDKLAARKVVRKYDRCFLPSGQQHVLSEAEEGLVRELYGESNPKAENSASGSRPAVVNKMRDKRGIILCPAGHKSFHIDPKGDIYCCMSALDRARLFNPWALPHYQPIGNIKDSSFTYLEKPILCWEAFRCSACDYENLQSAWHFVSPERLPLPE